MALPEGDGVLSNEAMYRKTWATFVDGAISQHQQQASGGGAEGGGSVGGAGGRIELRDVMGLEEVLAKIEHAEGGWIDHANRPTTAATVGLLGDGSMETESSSAGLPSSDSLLRRNDRKSLQPTISGLPPMFENPRPSFFAPMYNNLASSPVQAGGIVKDDGPPPPPPLNVRASRPSMTGNDGQGIGPRMALDPGRCSSMSDKPNAAGVHEGRQYSPQGDGHDGRETDADSDPRKPVCFSTGAKSSGFPPASDAVAPEDAGGQVVDDSDTPPFEECGVVSTRGRGSSNSRRGAVVVSEDESRHCSESLSVGSEVEVAQSISRELLPKLMGSLNLGGRRTPSPVTCNLLEPSRQSSQGAVHHHTAGEEGMEEEVEEEVQQGEQVQPALSISDGYSSDNYSAPAAAATSCEEKQFSVTPKNQTRDSQQQHGDGEEEEEVADRSLERGEEAAQPSASFADTLPRPDPFPEDVMLSQLSAQLNATHIKEAGDEDSSGAVEGREGPLSSAKSEGKAGALGVTMPDDNHSNGSGLFTSPPASVGLLDRPALISSMHADNSVDDPGTSDRRSGPQHGPSPPGGPRREPRGREDDHLGARVDPESPELLRLGSASQNTDGVRHHDPSLDHESWGVGAAAGRTRGSGDVGIDRNDAAMFSLAHSPDGVPIGGGGGGGESQAFGSMPSPDIGGFGRIDDCDGVHALSPLTLAGSFVDSDADDGGDGACEDEGGGGGGGGSRDLSPGGVRGDCCGLSPVRSARSESTVDPDGGPSPSQRAARRTSFADEAGESEEDEDITLTPEVSRSLRLNDDYQPLFAMTSAGGSTKEDEEDGDCEWENLETSSASIEEEEEEVKRGGSGMMPPPPPRQPSLTPRQRKEQRQLETPEDGRFPPNNRRGRAAFNDGTNTPAGRYGERSRDEEESLSYHTGANCSGGGVGGGGGSGGYEEQVSIGSFSESEKGGSRIGGSFCEGGGEGDKENADGSSLVEGTPRRRRVANIAKKEPKGLGLSTLQRSTLQWMLWREGSEEGGGGGGGGGAGKSGRSTAAAAAAAAASFDSDNAVGVNVKGGVLGHLRSEEALACVHALVHGGVASDDAAEGRTDRARPVHAVTGLPCGGTLILAPTKEAAWQWSDRLESGVDGLSVLSYVMPLRERRRLSAKQAAAFDVVVTTYDVVKATEVPRGVEATKATSPRSWALPGSKEWRARNTKEDGQKRPVASKTDHVVSLLHGVWWDRVVADGAQILANQRSARAVAALSLVGSARWCVVGRESMAAVENASERMRCLTAFLRIPVEVPMVEVAESLFYHSRPSHIAPLHPRSGSGAADNSLSLTEGDESQSSPGSSQRQQR